VRIEKEAARDRISRPNMVLPEFEGDDKQKEGGRPGRIMGKKTSCSHRMGGRDRHIVQGGEGGKQCKEKERNVGSGGVVGKKKDTHEPGKQRPCPAVRPRCRPCEKEGATKEKTIAARFGRLELDRVRFAARRGGEIVRVETKASEEGEREENLYSALDKCQLGEKALHGSGADSNKRGGRAPCGPGKGIGNPG